MIQARARLARSVFLLCLLGGFAFWILIVNDFSRLDGWIVQNEVMIGHDFVNVWTGGRLVLDHRVADLYDLSAYRSAQHAYVGHALVGHNYSYPPLGLPLTVPFGALPYPLALAAWTVVTAALFVVAARPWLRDLQLSPLFALLLPASILNIWNGHYGFLIGALWLSGWSAIDDRPRAAGLRFGLIAIKPHIGIMVPLILAIRGQWAAFVAAAVTIIVLILTSILLFGLAPWSDYLSVTAGQQSAMIDAGSAFFASLSTSSATSMFGLGANRTLAFATHGLVAATAIYVVADSARHRSIPSRELALIAATATFLVLPYAFLYDLTVVSLAALWTLIYRADRLSRPQSAALVVAFLGAQVGFLVSQLAGVLVTPLALLLQLAVQWRVAIAAANSTGPVAAPQQPQP